MNDNAYTEWQREQDAWMRGVNIKIVKGVIVIMLVFGTLLLICLQVAYYMATGQI